MASTYHMGGSGPLPSACFEPCRAAKSVLRGCPGGSIPGCFGSAEPEMRSEPNSVTCCQPVPGLTPIPVALEEAAAGVDSYRCVDLFV